MRVERGSWVYDRVAETLVPKAEWSEREARRIKGRGPMVIRDGMDPIRSMADGRWYESKRAYERAVREAGCEIVAGLDPASYVAMPSEGEPVEVSVKKALAESSR